MRSGKVQESASVAGDWDIWLVIVLPQWRRAKAKEDKKEKVEAHIPLKAGKVTEKRTTMAMVGTSAVVKRAEARAKVIKASVGAVARSGTKQRSVLSGFRRLAKVPKKRRCTKCRLAAYGTSHALD